MRDFKKLIFNNKGMSLIELTVAAAISVIISMGIVKTNQTGYKGMTKVSTDLDLKMWQQQQLMDVLADTGTCTTTFATTNINNGGAITNITYADGSEFLPSAPPVDIAGGQWTITGMSRSAWTPESSANPNKGIFTFNVNVTRKNKESFGARDKILKVDIVAIKADSTNDLVSCSSSSSGSDTYWSLDIAENTLSSQGRNVLVGSSGGAPLAPFQVELAGGEWLGNGASGIRKSMNISGLNQAITIGSSGRENSAIFGNQQADIYGTNSDCLVLATGNRGSVLPGVELCDDVAKINSTNSAGRAGITGAVVLGSSSAMAGGLYSVAVGERAQASGSFAFAQGRGAVASGDYSSAIGTSARAQGQHSVALGLSSESKGYESVAIGASRATGQGSIAIGRFNSDAQADSSLVFGTGARTRGGHDYSFVLSDGSLTWSTNQKEFTAHFDNGFNFITNNAPYPSGTAANDAISENTGVFIDPTGNMGIGKDLNFTSDSQFGEGVKPKLFVKGNVEITGSLYANGEKVGAGGAGGPCVQNDQTDCYIFKDTHAATPSTHTGIHTKIKAAFNGEKYYGLIGDAGLTTAPGSAWYYGVAGIANHAAAGSGRSFGVYGVASNSSSGYNYGTVGYMAGANNGAGIYGTLSWPGAVSGRYAGFFNGNLHATGSSTSSDIRLKEDVENLENSLEKILKVRGVSYNWKNKLDRRGKNKEIGVIAQELELIYPDLVDVVGEKDDIKDAKAVTYNGLIPPIIEAIKEFYSQVMEIFSEHDEKIAALETENKILKEKLNRQQEAIQKIQLELSKKKI